MTPEERAREIVENWWEGQGSNDPPGPVDEMLAQALRDYGNAKLEEAAIRVVFLAERAERDAAACARLSQGYVTAVGLAEDDDPRCSGREWRLIAGQLHIAAVDIRAIKDTDKPETK